MKKYIFIALACLVGQPSLWSQEIDDPELKEMLSLPKPYHPEEDGDARITELLDLAKKKNKKLLIQVGGNWCIWSLRFNNLVFSDPELKALVDKKYIYYHLNSSPENQNEKAFAKYGGNPGEEFGFPAFIILDKKGKVLRRRASSDLEEGNGHSKEKVKQFLKGKI